MNDFQSVFEWTGDKRQTHSRWLPLTRGPGHCCRKGDNRCLSHFLHAIAFTLTFDSQTRAFIDAILQTKRHPFEFQVHWMLLCDSFKQMSECSWTVTFRSTFLARRFHSGMQIPFDANDASRTNYNARSRLSEHSLCVYLTTYFLHFMPIWNINLICKYECSMLCARTRMAFDAIEEYDVRHEKKKRFLSLGSNDDSLEIRYFIHSTFSLFTFCEFFSQLKIRKTHTNSAAQHSKSITSPPSSRFHSFDSFQDIWQSRKRTAFFPLFVWA